MKIHSNFGLIVIFEILPEIVVELDRFDKKSRNQAFLGFFSILGRSKAFWEILPNHFGVID